MLDKNRFIDAYVWMFGSTKMEAIKTYSRAMSVADYGYIKEIIACFEDNAKRCFYDD